MTGYRKNLPIMPSQLTPLQEEALTGTLLGDACLFRADSNSRPYLSIKRMPSDRPYLEWQYSFFKDFMTRPVHETTYFSSKIDPETHEKVRFKYTAVQMVSRSADAFIPFYDKWYPNGKKIVPRDLKLTPLILTEWFCDDGCVVIKEGGKRLGLELSTHGFTLDDVKFLKSLLEERYNEKFSISKKRGLYCSDAPARKFYLEIDPYIPPALERKADKWRTPQIDIFNQEIGASRLKRQAEIKSKIEEALLTHPVISMMDLALITDCIHMNAKPGWHQIDYGILNKYLKPYKQYLVRIKGSYLYDNLYYPY